MGSSIDKAEEKGLLKSEQAISEMNCIGNNNTNTLEDFRPEVLGPPPYTLSSFKLEGVKSSSGKAPMGKLLKQFPLALEAVAKRSGYGHEKYKDTDHDWMNFKRVPNAISEYEDAIVRHLSGIGEPEETSLDHLTAAAWNVLAKLQLVLEQKTGV